VLLSCAREVSLLCARELARPRGSSEDPSVWSCLLSCAREASVVVIFIVVVGVDLSVGVGVVVRARTRIAHLQSERPARRVR
jgi:hypothetical protein